MSGKKSAKSRQQSEARDKLLKEIEQVQIDVKHCEENGWTDTAAHTKLARLLAKLEDKENGTSIK